MLVEDLYASSIRLRFYNTIKKENNCKQCDSESGFSPKCDGEIWELTWKERVEKYFEKA